MYGNRYVKFTPSLFFDLEWLLFDDSYGIGKSWVQSIRNFVQNFCWDFFSLRIEHSYLDGPFSHRVVLNWGDIMKDVLFSSNSNCSFNLKKWSLLVLGYIGKGIHKAS